MKSAAVIAVVVALAAAEIVVQSLWLHVLIVAAIVAVLIPVGRDFARRES
jgi:hypothetical protein